MPRPVLAPRLIWVRTRITSTERVRQQTARGTTNRRTERGTRCPHPDTTNGGSDPGTGERIDP